MDFSKMTGPQRANYHYMADAMRRLEWDLHNHIEATGRVPQEWHEIAKEKLAKRKVQTTIRIDEDVLRFFKSMGAGHLPRMNAVLRSYMHARLAGVLKGAETVDFYRRQREDYDGTRPMWGDVARMDGDLPPATEAEKAAERMARLREELKLRGLE
ncbi:BrnA antitoxin family protein [Cypionkella sp.]|uniref:BrnA antitoxin family protein n=1 Tax=Cypionkella sp. TaxID=2811411 RepID=UPI0037512076